MFFVITILLGDSPDHCEEKRVIAPIRQIQGSVKLGCKIKSQERFGFFFGLFFVFFLFLLH